MRYGRAADRKGPYLNRLVERAEQRYGDVQTRVAAMFPAERFAVTYGIFQKVRARQVGKSADDFVDGVLAGLEADLAQFTEAEQASIRAHGAVAYERQFAALRQAAEA